MKDDPLDHERLEPALRRTLIGTFAGAALLVLLAAPLAAHAQPAARIVQVGLLSGGSASNSPELVDTFRDRLRELGWKEGRNLRMVYRYAEGELGRLPELAAELVRMKVDVILAPVPASLAAARNATRTIPIVMVFGPDPVESGLVASLAHPGGNITGLTSLSDDLGLKQLELLRDMVPGLARVAVLWNPGNPWHRGGMKRVEAAARALGLSLQLVAERSPPTGRTAPTCSAAPPATSTGFSAGHRPAIWRSSSRPSSIW
jgi:putative ABC transport system substrate-binding protein